MTMKKVIIFALVLALALGGIGFAHAAVTANQDDLKIFSTVELGDPSVLEGLTAEMTVTCGEHLRWSIDYPFGGQAVTEFVYDRKGTQPPQAGAGNYLDLWLSGGVSSSVSGGSFTPGSSGYGPLLLAVASQTPDGGSRTMALEMSDYVNYYLPDYELRYEHEARQCHENASTHGLVTGEGWYENPGCYTALMEAFRFPVQENHIMSVTVQKDEGGRIVSIELSPEDGPELHFLSDVTDQGIWFVPVFRTAEGTPLPYESPQGHGIYFIPWKHNDLYHWTEGKPEQVTPDVQNVRLCYPLAEDLRIERIIIDAEAGTAQMLTLEEGQYILTTCDLDAGSVRSRLVLLDQDPGKSDSSAWFQQKGAYLLHLIQGNVVLTDRVGETLLLTAPDVTDQRFGGVWFDPDSGDLRFDGETLILIDTAWYYEGTFWAAAWRQGELMYYGEYDCSLLQNRDNWYYSYITAEEYPIVLK